MFFKSFSNYICKRQKVIQTWKLKNIMKIFRYYMGNIDIKYKSKNFNKDGRIHWKFADQITIKLRLNVLWWGLEDHFSKISNLFWKRKRRREKNHKITIRSTGNWETVIRTI